MSLLDILQQVVSAANAGAAAPSADIGQQFDQVAGQAPQSVLQQGVADAMRSDQTAPFGELVSQMFGQAAPEQRADMLNHILTTLGPGVLGALAAGGAGGVLGGLLRQGGQSGAAVAAVTPEQAAQITPTQMNEIATRAEQANPGIIDSLSGFYAQHPGLVKTLGGAVLAFAMAKMHERLKG